MARNTVLVVDDEPDIVELLTYNLKKEGYDTLTARTGEEALQVITRQKPDLIILDIMLPEIDGFEVCKRVREDHNIPIIMLTAKGDEVDKVLGLELGADDYVTKPFSPRELLARVKAVLRRSETQAGKEAEPVRLQAGGICIDVASHEVRVNGNAIELTPKEFALLRFMMTRRNRVLTRDYLLQEVWGYDFTGETRTVDVHIRRLREKLGERGRLIETVHGVGYKFAGESDAPE